MRGIININKPQNFTSHDCVAIVRRQTGIQKVGHTGTLDPMATGVLPICIGPATRIIEYLDEDQKEYRCGMRLGIHTDTCDIWGKVLEEKKAGHLTEDEIRSAFASFAGEIDQVPPMYSALKVKGRKLYEYARSGQEVEIRPRKVTIHSLEVEEIRQGDITFRVICSKGTYLRSICRDVGEALGAGGTMTSLVRLASGIFRIEDTVDIEDIRTMTREEITGRTLPMDFPLAAFGMVQVDRQTARDFIHGKRIVPGGTVPGGRVRIYYGHIFLGMADHTEQTGELKADKVFHTEI